MQKFETPDIESSTDDYATRFSGQIGEWFLDVQMKATLKPIVGESIDTVLDVGGGHGQLTEGLVQNGYQVIVTGSSESCKKRLLKFLDSDSVRFEVCPLVRLPYSDAEIDVSVSYRMLSHLDAWRDLIQEMCRVSGKYVMVDYPTYRSFNILNKVFFKLKKGLEKNTRHFTIFEERDIIREFQRHGFQLKSRKGQFVLPMAFHRAHKIKKIGVFVEGLLNCLGFSYLLGSPVIACFERVDK